MAGACTPFSDFSCASCLSECPQGMVVAQECDGTTFEDLLCEPGTNIHLAASTGILLVDGVSETSTNVIDGNYNVLASGMGNNATGSYNALLGGSSSKTETIFGVNAGNRVSLVETAEYSIVVGGQQVKARSPFQFTASGYQTTIPGVLVSDVENVDTSSVSGTIRGAYAVALGACSSTLDGSYSVLSGLSNLVNNKAEFSTLLGGWRNTAENDYMTLLGGKRLYANAKYATNLGGLANKVKGKFGTIAGGNANTVRGRFTMAMGRRAIVQPRCNPPSSPDCETPYAAAMQFTSATGRCINRNPSSIRICTGFLYLNDDNILLLLEQAQGGRQLQETTHGPYRTFDEHDRNRIAVIQDQTTVAEAGIKQKKLQLKGLTAKIVALRASLASVESTVQERQIVH